MANSELRMMRRAKILFAKALLTLLAEDTERRKCDYQNDDPLVREARPIRQRLWKETAEI